ncbi:MAG: hypothetical protein A3F18_04335 [Legionellales bacterium RIFCSPHIGHO2_12_FULL_37_14]|nr:MAG: hypothetical protein A3F18_04335 [Legionellales bacterium RIFCSPHIGHO2_12_FULL_37_14]
MLRRKIAGFFARHLGQRVEQKISAAAKKVQEVKFSDYKMAENTVGIDPESLVDTNVRASVDPDSFFIRRKPVAKPIERPARADEASNVNYDSANVSGLRENGEYRGDKPQVPDAVNGSHAPLHLNNSYFYY